VSISFRLGSVFLAAALVFAAAFTSPARAEIIQNEAVSFEGDTFTHPITNEELTLHGSAHLLVSITQNSQGAHSTVSANYQGVTAVSASGTEYNLIANDRDKASLADDLFPGIFSAVRTARLVSKGAEENVIVRSTWRIVINNNGTITVERTRNEILIVGDGENDN
jgi:hypothetical protein